MMFCLCVFTVTHEEAASFCLPWEIGLSLGNINYNTLFVDPKVVPKTLSSTSETKICIP